MTNCLRCITATVSIAVLCFGGCTGGTGSSGSELKMSLDGINLCRKEVGKTFTWQNFQMRNVGKENLIIQNIELRGDANCAFQLYREPADGMWKSADGSPLDAPYRCPQEGEKAPPFSMTMPPNTSRIIRIDYTPSAPGEVDQAAIVITSNASNLMPEEDLWKKVVVPLCGTGLSSNITRELGVDAGLDAAVDAGGDSDIDGGNTGDAGGDADADTDSDVDTDVDTDTDTDTDMDLDCPECRELLGENAPWCQGGYGK